MRLFQPRAAFAGIACMALLLAAPAYALHDVVIINQYPPPDLSEHLVFSDPSANATLARPPELITLTFARPVRKSASAVKVVDMYGNIMTDGTVSVDNEIVSATVSGLSPGKYRVRWRTEAVEDMQMISGDFTFTVLEPPEVSSTSSSGK